MIVISGLASGIGLWFLLKYHTHGIIEKDNGKAHQQQHATLLENDVRFIFVKIIFLKTELYGGVYSTISLLLF